MKNLILESKFAIKLNFSHFVSAIKKSLSNLINFDFNIITKQSICQINHIKCSKCLLLISFVEIYKTKKSGNICIQYINNIFDILPSWLMWHKQKWIVLIKIKKKRDFLISMFNWQFYIKLLGVIKSNSIKYTYELMMPVLLISFKQFLFKFYKFIFHVFYI